jgi:hypothetical protein
MQSRRPVLQRGIPVTLTNCIVFFDALFLVMMSLFGIQQERLEREARIGAKTAKA